MNPLPNGLIVVAKRECPTCLLVEPVLRELADGEAPLTVYTQDDPAYAAGVGGVILDDTLETSYRLGIEIVPTLINVGTISMPRRYEVSSVSSRITPPTPLA